MKKNLIALHFEIVMQSTAENLWNCLWQPENYQQWTSKFCAGNYYETTAFEAGSDIRFLTPSGQGMYSVIETLVQTNPLRLNTKVRFPILSTKTIPMEVSCGRMHVNATK